MMLHLTLFLFVPLSLEQEKSFPSPYAAVCCIYGYTYFYLPIILMLEEESIKIAALQFGVILRGNDFAANKQLLAERINELIQKDFQKLVSILYRLDISEEKLKYLLKENSDSDAGFIIAELIIERQIQKKKSRQQFSKRDDDIDENEKW